MKHIAPLGRPVPIQAIDVHQTLLLDILDAVLNGVLSIGRLLLPFFPEKTYGA